MQRQRKRDGRQRLAQMEQELVGFVNSLTLEQIGELGNRLEQQNDQGRIGYAAYVRRFQQCWDARNPMHRDTANLTLDAILTENPHNAERLETLKLLGKQPSPTDQQPRPVFSVDLTGQGIRANTRDYIDQLALTLIVARRRLGVCLAEGCKQPYFIARYPRQHYCSAECLAVGRRASKRAWARMNYAAASSSEFGIRGNAPSLVGHRQKRKHKAKRHR